MGSKVSDEIIHSQNFNGWSLRRDNSHPTLLIDVITYLFGIKVIHVSDGAPVNM